MPAPSRDPRLAGSGATDTSHLFSTLHNAEIRSMFLPHGGSSSSTNGSPSSDTKPAAASASNGREKVVALSLGNLCLPPKGIAAQEPTPASTRNPLSHYWYCNAVLCGGNPHGSSSGNNGNTSSAATTTTILENGQVLVHSLTNDQEGPVVVGSIDPPPAAPAWGSVLNATGGGDGGMETNDLKLPMEVTCASLIPAEIAIQQFWQVHHTLAPGNIIITSSSSSTSASPRGPSSKPPSPQRGGGITTINNNNNNKRKPSSASVFQEPLLPNREAASSDGEVAGGGEGPAADETVSALEASAFDPLNVPTASDADVNLVSSVADALLGNDPISKSWRRRPDARQALEAHYSKHTAAEWRSSVVNHLWRGVVGTDSGEVFVFNGERYCFGFRCGAQRPSSTRQEIEMGNDNNQNMEYKKLAPSQSGSVSNAGIVSVHTIMLPDESESGGGGLVAARNAAAQQQQQQRQGGGATNRETSGTSNSNNRSGAATSNTVQRASSQQPLNAYTSSSNHNSNLSMQTCPSDITRPPPAPSRVGFVTLQSDGNICVWKLKLQVNAKQSPSIEAVPVRLIQPSLLAKVRTLTVSHQYTIPMELSNYGAVFSASAGQDLGSQFGWEDPFTPQMHPFVQELESLLGGGGITGGRSTSAPGSPGGGPATPASASFAISSACSSSAFTPAQYLPFISIVAFSGAGYDASVALRSGFGHVLDCDSKGDDVTIGDSRLRHTTAMAMEGDYVLVARERAIHLVIFGDRSIRKLMTTRSRVRCLVLDRPIAIAGCQNGDIHVFACDSGIPLTTYSTYNGSPVKALSFHYQAMLLTVVDEDSGEVELVSLPGILLRYGVLPPEKMLTRQGTVLRHSMALQETPAWKLSAKREAAERRLLAKFSLASCVEQYLNFRTKLI